jgi:hypothetical protein
VVGGAILAEGICSACGCLLVFVVGSGTEGLDWLGEEGEVYGTCKYSYRLKSLQRKSGSSDVR